MTTPLPFDQLPTDRFVDEVERDAYHTFADQQTALGFPCPNLRQFREAMHWQDEARKTTPAVRSQGHADIRAALENFFAEPTDFEKTCNIIRLIQNFRSKMLTETKRNRPGPDPIRDLASIEHNPATGLPLPREPKRFYVPFPDAEGEPEAADTKEELLRTGIREELIVDRRAEPLMTAAKKPYSTPTLTELPAPVSTWATCSTCQQDFDAQITIGKCPYCNPDWDKQLDPPAANEVK